MQVCPKCSCTSIQVSQGGTRCSQCGFQSRSVSPRDLKNQPITYKSYGTPGQVYNLAIDKCEDVIALNEAWKKSKKYAEDPIVSIIMPTYKRRHTIFITIGSILNQTFTSWELIVIDNEPGNNYKFDDVRIKYHKHSEIPGAAHARNQGIQYVKSDLVCFFDDDDIMLPNYLECMVEPFNDPNIEMTICQVRLVEGRVAPHRAFCTPGSIVKKKYATPIWSTFHGHDLKYFNDIADSLPPDSIAEIPKVLVHAYTSPQGGLRGGAF